MDYDALKEEIEKDPEGLGYEAHLAVGSHAEVANLLNAVSGTQTVPRYSVSVQEIINEIDWEEIKPESLEILRVMFTAGRVDAGNTRVQKALLDAALVGSGTYNRLEELGSKSASRAQALFGQDVTHDQISKAIETKKVLIEEYREQEIGVDGEPLFDETGSRKRPVWKRDENGETIVMVREVTRG